MTRTLKTIAIVAAGILAVSCGNARKVAGTASNANFPELRKDGTVAVVAHRGFWNCDEAGKAQNSIAALRLAQENGFWGSEFDAQLTSDDVVIINHDNSINKKVIWDTPFAAFKDDRLKNGETIPTLDEYLEQGAKCATTMLVFELKQQKNEAREDVLLDKSIAALKAHKLYDPSRVVFISFSKHMCERLAAEHPQFVNQYLEGDLTPEELQAKGINGIDYQYALLAAHYNYITRCHELGMSTNVWTVNKENVMREMIEHGVDAITTNEPLLVRQVLGDRECKLK